MTATTPLEPTSIYRISSRFALFGGAIMLAGAILVASDVVIRALFGSTPLRSFELTTYGFAIACAFSYGFVLLERKHIRIDAIYRFFPKQMQVILDIVNVIVMTVLACGLSYHCTRVVIDSWEIGASSPSALQMPLVWPQGIWALGMIWFALCALFLLAAVVRDALARQWNRIHEIAGIDTEQDDV